MYSLKLTPKLELTAPEFPEYLEFYSHRLSVDPSKDEQQRKLNELLDLCDGSVSKKSAKLGLFVESNAAFCNVTPCMKFCAKPSDSESTVNVCAKVRNVEQVVKACAEPPEEISESPGNSVSSMDHIDKEHSCLQTDLPLSPCDPSKISIIVPQVQSYTLFLVNFLLFCWSSLLSIIYESLAEISQSLRDSMNQIEQMCLESGLQAPFDPAEVSVATQSVPFQNYSISSALLRRLDHVPQQDDSKESSDYRVNFWSSILLLMSKFFSVIKDFLLNSSYCSCASCLECNDDALNSNGRNWKHVDTDSAVFPLAVIGYFGEDFKGIGPRKLALFKTSALSSCVGSVLKRDMFTRFLSPSQCASGSEGKGLPWKLMDADDLSSASLSLNKRDSAGGRKEKDHGDSNKEKTGEENKIFSDTDNSLTKNSYSPKLTTSSPEQFFDLRVADPVYTPLSLPSMLVGSRREREPPPQGFVANPCSIHPLLHSTSSIETTQLLRHELTLASHIPLRYTRVDPFVKQLLSSPEQTFSFEPIIHAHHIPLNHELFPWMEGFITGTDIQQR